MSIVVQTMRKVQKQTNEKMQQEGNPQAFNDFVNMLRDSIGGDENNTNRRWGVDPCMGGKCCSHSNLSGSFGEMYYKLLDQSRSNEENKVQRNNIIITCDSLLYAWHYSYKSILEAVEVQVLYPSCKRLFGNMWRRMKEEFIPHRFSQFSVEKRVHNNFSSYDVQPMSLIEQGLQDLDFYTSLSNSLIHEKIEEPYYVENNHDVHYLFELLQRRCDTGTDFSSSCCLLSLFGEKRFFEFGVFQPNWFYIRDYMNGYFKLLSWCSVTYLDLTNLRQFTLILMLYLLLSDTKCLHSEYNVIEECFTKMVGKSDSLNCRGLTEFLREYFKMDADHTLESIAERLYYTLTLPDCDKEIRHLQKAALEKKLGLNYISNTTLKTPQSGVIGYQDEFTFCFFGSRFTFDAFIFSRTTFDRLVDLEYKRLLPRVIPTVVDLGLTLFDNGEITQKITEKTDPYFDVLLVRLQEVDEQIREIYPTMFTTSVHNLWLKTIRSISKISKSFNSCPNYSMKTLVTQCASFTHLKYDSSLFAKQHIETDIELMCTKEKFDINTEASEFAGINFLVEGHGEFFESFIQVLEFVRNMLRDDEILSGMTISSEAVSFYENFISTITILSTIHTKQMENVTLSEKEVAFLSNIIFAEKDTSIQQTENLKQVLTATTAQNYRVTGWYPNLFFKRADAGRYKPVVIGVHRYPDIDNGATLWEGVGPCQLFEYSHSDGRNYYGPMFTHFEFITPYTTRLNNSTWKSKLNGPNLTYNEWMTALSSKSCLESKFIGKTHLDHFTCAEYNTSQPSSGQVSPFSLTPTTKKD